MTHQYWAIHHQQLEDLKREWEQLRPEQRQAEALGEIRRVLTALHPDSLTDVEYYFLQVVNLVLPTGSWREAIKFGKI
jgi:hypothetical protein